MSATGASAIFLPMRRQLAFEQIAFIRRRPRAMSGEREMENFVTMAACLSAPDQIGTIRAAAQAYIAQFGRPNESTR